MVDGEWVDYDDCQLPCGLIILCIYLLSFDVCHCNDSCCCFSFWFAPESFPNSAFVDSQILIPCNSCSGISGVIYTPCLSGWSFFSCKKNRLFRARGGFNKSKQKQWQNGNQFFAVGSFVPLFNLKPFMKTTLWKTEAPKPFCWTVSKKLWKRPHHNSQQIVGHYVVVFFGKNRSTCHTSPEPLWTLGRVAGRLTASAAVGIHVKRQDEQPFSCPAKCLVCLYLWKWKMDISMTRFLCKLVFIFSFHDHGRTARWQAVSPIHLVFHLKSWLEASNYPSYNQPQPERSWTKWFVRMVKKSQRLYVSYHADVFGLRFRWLWLWLLSSVAVAGARMWWARGALTAHLMVTWHDWMMARSRWSFAFSASKRHILQKKHTTLLFFHRHWWHSLILCIYIYISIYRYAFEIYIYIHIYI